MGSRCASRTGLAPEQKALSDLIWFGDTEDDPIWYIDGLSRPSETWYEIAQKIAPHMLREPFRTTDGDGLPDVVDPDNGGTPLVPAPDSDGDGVPDYLDANDNPSISDIPNQSTGVSTPISVTFSISDTNDALDSLWLYAESSNLALVNGGLSGTLMMGGGISFGGSGVTRTITITVDDGEDTAYDTFVLAVGQVPANTPPTISDIADQSTTAGTPLGVTFVISDAETALNALGLSAASSDTTLVPLSGITFGGSGADRTATIAPTSGLTGTATITITVSDGELTDEDVFVLTVELHRLYLPLVVRNAGP